MKQANKADVLLGLQWGDEGKGKIVDVLTPGYQLIARFQGGPNAGHTLEFENRKYVLHTIPSGIFHSGTKNLIGSGVVIDPYIFSQELDHLDIGQEQLRESLLISARAHLITPSHRLCDAANEASRGKQKIGSTLKGIGPAYTDKIARSGLRLGDSLCAGFETQYQELREAHLRLVKGLGYSKNDFQIEKRSFDEYEKLWFEGLKRIQGLQLVESEVYINQALDQGVRVLAEGAQGTLLDIDFGSYPFVTSSNTIAAGACTGLGLAPSRIGEVYGIFKAYCTRVGSGPFPTELFDAHGDQLRKTGNEFGSTTGRPRRCGWLDLPALKYSVMLNGVTKLIMTKVDVLSELPQFKVCVGYEYDGQQVEFLPSSFEPEKLRPILQDFKGWHCDLATFSSIGELPSALKDYLKLIEDFVRVPIEIVSTGPDRVQTLFRK
ncbi:MAG: adenylosuccinate synthase [Bacteroidales bacterium]|jgi:adenylosuccinate synthase|nr:adenylosuccinate synthase [Bacteroidales bacterium]NLM92926.1 adenylosuccinate synthase [Bacteroidales bacterium]